MILTGKQLIEATILHAATGEKEGNVDDLLLNFKRKKLDYMTFKVLRPEKETQDTTGDRTLQIFMDGTHPQNVPATAMTMPEPDHATEEIRLIPHESIETLAEGTVTMSGTEREEGQRRPLETHSYEWLKGFSVETKSGEKIGKLKDVLIRSEDRTIVGLQLDEGWLEKVIGEGTKYMVLEDEVDVEVERIIIKRDDPPRLFDQIEELQKVL